MTEPAVALLSQLGSLSQVQGLPAFLVEAQTASYQSRMKLLVRTSIGYGANHPVQLFSGEGL